MKKLTRLIVLCLAMTAAPAAAETYLLSGGQQSVIRLHMVHSVVAPKTTRNLTVSFVKPDSFSSPTYSQSVEKFYVTYSKTPDREETRVDAYGNNIVEAFWESPQGTLSTAIDLAVNTSVKLEPLSVTASFPVSGLPPETGPYLAATAGVQSDSPEIRARAGELTAGAASQFDAVRRILAWTADHLRYVPVPDRDDALYALQTGRGNGQGYCHLAAALMRAAGIPVRIIGGVTLKLPWEVHQESGTTVMKNAQGRCLWMEVWFPELGWMPYDPLHTEMFVSSRHVRTAAGRDVADLKSDGLVQWVEVKESTEQLAGDEAKKSSPERLSCTENISAEFVSDNVKITARASGYGPSQRMLSPEVSAAFTKPAMTPAGPEPAPLTTVQMQGLSFGKPFLSGNLDFPENVDFAGVHEPVRQMNDGTLRTALNFLAETAEYVTTQGSKYAQAFILTEPVKVRNAGLALRSFSGDGQVWVELLKDGNGLPDQRIAVSDSLPAAGMKRDPGYHWVDFGFGGKDITLSPGRYWLALGFSGGPIVNWFFTYGKPSGLQDGTRFQTLFDKKWGSRLAFEFNYRIMGMAAEQPQTNHQ